MNISTHIAFLRYNKNLISKIRHCHRESLLPRAIRMLQAIEEHHQTLIVLCRQFGVRRLDLFGSAATRSFQPGKSDLDFLVEFEGDSYHGMADRYFGLLEGLEALFGVRVDLVVASAVKNPYFQQGIENTKQTLYVKSPEPES